MMVEMIPRDRIQCVYLNLGYYKIYFPNLHTLTSFTDRLPPTYHGVEGGDSHPVGHSTDDLRENQQRNTPGRQDRDKKGHRAGHQVGNGKDCFASQHVDNRARNNLQEIGK